MYTGLYYSNWSVYEKNHTPVDIPLQHVTHIYYSFIRINRETGALKWSDEWADLQKPLPFRSSKSSGYKLPENMEPAKGAVRQFQELNKHFPQLKLIFSIGGWGYADDFKVVTADKGKRARLVSDCLNFLEKYSFHGVDIDWEYPENKQEARNLTAFVRELSKAFRGRFTISVAVAGFEEKLKVLEYELMDPYINMWNVMCYDLSGQWSDRAKYHSNLYRKKQGDLSCDDAINFIISKGVNSRKVNLGMPNYGKSFIATQVGDSFKDVGPGSCGEKGIWEGKSLPIGNEAFDYKCVSAYCTDGQTLVVYDNQVSAQLKAQYVRERNLAGGFWWDSSGDWFYEKKEKSNLVSFIHGSDEDSQFI